MACLPLPQFYNFKSSAFYTHRTERLHHEHGATFVVRGQTEQLESILVPRKYRHGSTDYFRTEYVAERVCDWSVLFCRTCPTLALNLWSTWMIKASNVFRGHLFLKHTKKNQQSTCSRKFLGNCFRWPYFQSIKGLQMTKAAAEKNYPLQFPGNLGKKKKSTNGKNKTNTSGWQRKPLHPHPNQRANLTFPRCDRLESEPRQLDSRPVVEYCTPSSCAAKPCHPVLVVHLHTVLLSHALNMF